MNLVRRTEGREPALLNRLDPFRTFHDLLRWDPFAEMQPLFGTSDLGLMPNIEVKETKDSVIFKADLPGMKEKDVEISVVGNRLSISGKREEEQKKEDERYYAHERWYGSFNRTFTLPDACNVEAVTAELRDGVLTIAVPKKESAHPRRIELGKGESSGENGLGKAEGESVEKAS